jgi:uncharacterized repeat protein (TIGR01451 family)
MNRVTFPPESGDRSGLHGRACPAASSVLGARALFVSGKGSFGLLACLLAVVAVFGSSRAVAADRQQLNGHVPAVIQRMNLQSTGELPGANRLNLAIGLPLRNPADLDTLLKQIYDPASANYHKYLTPEQFTQRFGPTEQDYQALVDFAQASGLEADRQQPNRMLLDVQGAVADIEKAFQVKMRVYQHPKENRTFFAPDVEPSVPAGLPVLDISGLNSYARPHPQFVRRPINLAQPDGATPNLGSGPAGSYFGYDFRSAYAPGVSLTGSGQTLALVEFDGYLAGDIVDYCAQAGLPDVPLQNVLLDGFNGVPTGTGGEVEVSLDIEMANAMAPGLSRIISYEGDPVNFFPNDVLNAIATANSARQISCSWGWTGGPTATTDNIFKKMDAQGQTFFTASGDSDSLATGEADDPTLTWVPSDNPYITAVGATTLSTTGPLGSFVSETVWQAGNGVGSTGGISAHYAIPVWQQPVSMATNGGSTAFRNFPDVAMVGDNIYVVADSGTPMSDVAGTSCAAPLWAAFTALMNEKSALGGGASLGFLNPALYAICLGPLYNSCLHDVTNGNNFSLTNTTQFTAVPGYDLCTGFGSPAGAALINALVPTSIVVPVLQVLSNTLSGGNGAGVIDPNGCDNLNVLVTNVGNAAATDVQGILTSLTPGVIIGRSIVSFPNIPAGGTAVNQTPFTISTEPTFVCGTTVLLQLVLKCDQTVQTNFIQFATGTLGPPLQFNNTTPVSNPGLGRILSTNLVTGVNSIGKVTVSVYITAEYDELLELELISPNGTPVLLAELDGAAGANFGTSCPPGPGCTTFDDAAPQSISVGIAPMSGSYAPLTPLSVLNLMTGTNANGVWQLSVVNLDSGYPSTLNCWSLSITPEFCADGGGQCPGADLSLAMKASPITTPVGGPVTYTLSVSNAGPSPAENAVVYQTLPSSMVYQGAVSSQGSVSQVGPAITVSLGTLGIQSNATITVTTVATTPGLFTSTANVGSPSPDPNPDNNNASASVLVTKPMADLSAGMSVSPGTVPVGGRATFVVGVTNHGPETALNVTVTNFLPANVNVISATASQGSVSGGGTLASIGTLLKGSGATVTLVLNPTVVGTCTLTSTVGLDPAGVDPVPGNNSANASVNVVPAADLAVFAVASPSPAISGSNIAYVVTVTNGGPATATSVVMNQTLPAGVIFVSTSQPTAVDSGGVVTWTIGTMPNGTSQTLTNIIKAPTLLQGISSNVLVSTFSVFGQPGNPNTNDSFASVTTVVLRPMVIISLLSATLISESLQPPNGAVNPGETVGVQFLLQNVGNIPTTNLVATLQTNGGVFPLAGHGQATYGRLAPGGGVGSGQFMFTNNSTNGGAVVASLQLQDGPTSLGTVSFTFLMPAVSTFWNNQVIFIPGTNYVATNNEAGPAGPDPSRNLVSGVSAYVSDVSITVSNLEHSFPHDISLLLVGPGGQSCVLMSAAADHTSASIPVTITFDQNAPTPVPSSGSLFTGSYQPAEYNSPIFTNFSLSPSYNTNLSVFAGAPVNGWWSLYAYDGHQGDHGAISNGWGLGITTITPVNQIADLGVAIAASPDQVMLGSNVAFTITVTNSSTNATYVFLTNVLGAGLSFVSNTVPAYAPYQQTGQTQYYSLGTLVGQTNLTLGFVANAASAGVLTSTVNIGSSLIDPNTNNNQASASVTVGLPAAVLSAAISASVTNTVVVNSNVIYTLTVTNNGPDLALNVIGLLTQGAGGPAATVFSNYFGAISPGFIATALFTNAPAVTGSLTNTWTVYTTNSTDTSHHAATLVLAVTYPVPVIAANGAILLSGNIAPPNGAINSNETVTMAFTFENIGAAPTANLTAALLATNGVFAPSPASQNYGIISPGASAAQNFSFTARGVPGSTITAVFALTNNGSPLGTVSFPFTLANPLTFNNAALIVIPDEGPGTPYPSEILVSTTNGVIGHVTAALQGFTHSYPRDVNVLLISPSGQQAVLMAHAGGPYSVTNLVLAFDDTSTNSLTDAILVSGANHATLIPPLDYYPGISGQPSNTNLSVFNGGNPNGVWSLYVLDDKAGNDGSIANGWTLGLTMVNPVNPPGSLAVGVTGAPNPVFTGNYLTFLVAVTNLGPSGSTNVLLTDTLPSGAALVSAAASQGTVNTNVTGLVSFNFGILANAGDTATATIQVQPLQTGVASNSATATNSAGAGATVAGSVTVLNPAPFYLQATNINQNLRLTLEGSAGQNYIIQVSANLTTWTDLSTNTATGVGVFTIINGFTNGPARFYRALHLPQ